MTSSGRPRRRQYANEADLRVDVRQGAFAFQFGDALGPLQRVRFEALGEEILQHQIQTFHQAPSLQWPSHLHVISMSFPCHWHKSSRGVSGRLGGGWVRMEEGLKVMG